jgi:hypothetical protein
LRGVVVVGGSLLLGALWVAGCSGDEAETPAPAAGAGGTSAAGTGGSTAGGTGGTAAGTGGTGGTTAGAGGTAAGAGGDSGAGGSAGAPVANEPTIDKLEQGKWNQLFPAGDTTCSDGSPFSYFVRPGASNKIVVEFSGGGACWNDFSCTAGAAYFNVNVETPKYVMDETTATGISNHGNDANPFKDWTHVFIPYCTGDIHAGDNIKTYMPSGTTIKHKGAVNARAALKWVYANAEKPDKAFVTGCSAGGYGATFWAPYVRQHYDNAGATKVYHFSDSAAGIISKDFFQEIADSWNTKQVYPSFIPGADPTDSAKLSTFYVAVANFYKDMPMVQYNTTYDETQSFYYNAITGDVPAGWTPLMNAEMKTIKDGTTTFHDYIAPDHKHCIIPYDEFYTVEVNGKKLVDTVTDLVNDKPIDNVECTDCGKPM